MAMFLTSIRVAVLTLLICACGYPALILGIAQAFTPGTANGSLLQRSDGTIVGSRLLAQAFTQPRYFWPRPSAVGYNAAGAGGSNKSPTSADLIERAQQTVAAYGATPQNPLPADLAAASGGGLDPHVTERSALYQVARVAAARERTPLEVESLVRRHAFAPGGLLSSARLVNVLELNLALDQMR
ncbi:MAG: potassium-transporting ATPase subunit C [Planctomycetes bacterium]|nr:potassium-transporting ATPase subunit C [Planctomycetota bacterium]